LKHLDSIVLWSKIDKFSMVKQNRRSWHKSKRGSLTY
jgi:hypothetical protein